MTARRRWLWIVLVALFAAGGGLAGCVTWPLAEGDRAPALAVTEWLHGTPPPEPRAGGQIVVVELWATWCGPCLDAIPHLDELQRRYRPHGVQVVAVAVWDQLEAVRRFVAERGHELSFAIGFDGDGVVQKQWRRNWWRNGIPATWVVDPRGRIAAFTHPAYADDCVARLLAGAWPSPAADVIDERWAAAQAARQAGDWATLDAIGKRVLATDGRSVTGWNWRIAAQRTPAARNGLVRQAIAAVREHPLELGILVHSLASTGRLLDGATDAWQALDAAAATPPGLRFPTARLLAAHAVGDAALAATTEALAAQFAERPYELVALVREVLPRPRTDPAEALLVRHAPRESLARAALQLLDAAGTRLGPGPTALLRFDLLVELGADAGRIDACGREVVAALTGQLTELNSFAWRLLTDAEHLAVTRAVALRAAEAMQAIPGWETPMYLDTVALARFENGDAASAVALQERAIQGIGENVSPAFRERLERYRQGEAASRSR